MSDLDITLYLNELRVRALADALGNQTAETVEDKLSEAFDALYQEYVPDELRSIIEAKVEREDAVEQARLEANRRFAVYHIRENGEGQHFTSDYFRTPLQAAYRYRLYSRSELSSEPKRFADAFLESIPITTEDYAAFVGSFDNERKLLSVMDFDLDEGCVSICDSGDNEWLTYALHDFSVAAYKAFRSDYRSEECRCEIFNSSLAGKELDLSDETFDEIEAPATQMWPLCAPL